MNLGNHIIHHPFAEIMVPLFGADWLAEQYVKGNVTLGGNIVDGDWQDGDLLEAIRQYSKIPRKFPHIPRFWKSTVMNYSDDPRFFELILGKWMKYSCAYWSRRNNTLDEAQMGSMSLCLNHVWGKEEKPRLLETGCGFGAVPNYLAWLDVSVEYIGITNSKTHHDYAERYDAKSGRQSIQIAKTADWEDSKGTAGFYDGVISIGMIEHIPARKKQKYFDHCAKSLKTGGRMYLQFVSRDGAKVSPFTDKHVFPNVDCPSLKDVLTMCRKAGLEATEHLEHGSHYALTAKAWRENLHANKEEIIERWGWNHFRFYDLYFAATQVSFEDGINKLYRVKLVKLGYFN